MFYKCTFHTPITFSRKVFYLVLKIDTISPSYWVFGVRARLQVTTYYIINQYSLENFEQITSFFCIFSLSVRWWPSWSNWPFFSYWWNNLFIGRNLHHHFIVETCKNFVNNLFSNKKINGSKTDEPVHKSIINYYYYHVFSLLLQLILSVLSLCYALAWITAFQVILATNNDTINKVGKGM